eukprot:m.11234 g.11234  ORF g.11234 m.11234 type:complete len:278 (+) comp23100_c0_seq1:24-857(+)
MISCLCIFACYAFFAYATFQRWKNKYNSPDAVRSDTHPRIVLKALDRAFDTANFANAVITTILSSIVLFKQGLALSSDVTAGKPSSLAAFTVEAVCGYLLVELPVLLYCRYASTRWDVREFRAEYDGLMAFHSMALAGLLSVLAFDAGYVVALWEIWSEFTSVLLGIETFFEINSLNLSHMGIYAVLAVLTTISFVVQRVFVFLYLLWLCWSQFVWSVYFCVQFGIQLAATVTNTVFAADMCYWTGSWLKANYITSHESIWANTHETIFPWKTDSYN